VVLCLWAWEFNERHPRTDDAVSRANIIGIAPRVSGPIIKINVTDNQFAKGGDLLFEIDPADFQLSVDRAKSALDALDQQIEVAKAQDAQIKSQVKAAEAAVRQALRNEIKLADSLRRLEPLLPKATPPQNKLTRRAPKSPPLTPRSRKPTRNLTRPMSPSAPWPRCKPTPGGIGHLWAAAQLALSYTRMYAPFDGQVVGLNISEGAYAHAGVEVFAFLDSRKW